MNAVQRSDWISPAEYLAAELHAPRKSEYVGGAVYAMSGASNRHNRIATNITTALSTALRGQRCQAFNSDTKVRVAFPTHIRFYYPDAMVVCHPNPDLDSYQDNPALIVEVLSTRTRRLDQGEKQEAYLTIPSLQAYLLVEPDDARIVVLRRTDRGFQREVQEGLDTRLNLPEIGIELNLSDVYERVAFSPEPEEDENLQENFRPGP